MESYFEYTWCQLLLIGMACSGPSPAAELTSKETSWTFIFGSRHAVQKGGPKHTDWRTFRGEILP